MAAELLQTAVIAPALRVLFIDRAWPVVLQVVKDFAAGVEPGVHVTLLSDKEPSAELDNLTVLNIRDVPQRRSLAELQQQYPFSVHRALIPERAFYDYSSLRKSQCYSRLSEQQIERLITPYANAFDYAIRERADFVMEWYPDCFIPALAGRIAAYYGKPFRMFLQHYWWSDGAFFIDGLDLTSSTIERLYRQHYSTGVSEAERARLDEVFRTKKTLYAFSQSEMYTFAMRLRVVMNRMKSYEPFSALNWVQRRISRRWSSIMIRSTIRRETLPGRERFVLYPLHISPEAALLGNTPELADQLGLIRNISMHLPYGVKLYVKEHPYADLGGGIDYSFYRRLAALPNVRIMRGDASLNALMDHPGFLAVAVINGTLGLDAALRRKPVFVFGKPLYRMADCLLRPANFEEFHSQLSIIIAGRFHFDEGALYAMLAALDGSIVRADVDFLSCRTATELMRCFPSIMLNYIRSRAWVAGH